MSRRIQLEKKRILEAGLDGVIKFDGEISGENPDLTVYLGIISLEMPASYPFKGPEVKIGSVWFKEVVYRTAKEKFGEDKAVELMIKVDSQLNENWSPTCKILTLYQMFKEIQDELEADWRL